MPVDQNVSFWPGWETVRLIGRGSFGAVYEIQRKLFEDDEEVEKAALKVISIPQNDSDIEEMYNDGYDEESVTSSFRSRLKSIVAEYSLMRKMNGSANIVNCDDVRYEQHADGIGWDIYIKMELLTPLAKSLPGTVSDTQVIAVAKDMCEALELCDKHNIVHRDIKPQNILVSPNGDYKLGDFGIAKTVEKTMGGTKTGTYKYMAPEVYNNKPYNSTADIYSLGLVLYWLLNERRMPFIPLPPAKLSAGMDKESRQRRFSGEAIPAPKNGSEELKRIILKACSFDPKDRYQSAQEMQEDLMRLSGGIDSVPVVIPTQNSLAVQESEVSDEATDGPDLNQNMSPDMDELDKTVGPQFSKAINSKKSIKKKKIGIIAAAVLVLAGLCSVFFFLWNPMPKYTLMEDRYEDANSNDLHTKPVFCSKYQRQQIRSITFLASIKDAPSDSWDVSQEQNGTVLAWVRPVGNMYNLFLAADGGILAPESCEDLFAGYTNLLQIDFNKAFNTTNVKTMYRMFYNCNSLNKLDLSRFDTANVTNMQSMFNGCNNLKQLDLSRFNTSKVTNMYCMFHKCSNLTELDVSCFDTAQVTNMGGMFLECYKLTKLDVSHFDTGSVTSMYAMFYKCSSLKELDVSNFNTSRVTTMRNMFYACNSLTKLDVGGFDTAKVTDMGYMFHACSNLRSLDVSNFNTTNVTGMDCMFLECSNLVEPDLSAFDVSKVENYENFMDPGRTINGRPWEEFFRK